MKDSNGIIVRLFVLTALGLFACLGIGQAAYAQGAITRVVRALTSLKASKQIPPLVVSIRGLGGAESLTNLATHLERVNTGPIGLYGLYPPLVLEFAETTEALRVSGQLPDVLSLPGMVGTSLPEAFEAINPETLLRIREAAREAALQYGPPRWGPDGTTIETQVNVCQTFEHVEFLCGLKNVLDILQSPDPGTKAKIEYYKAQLSERWSFVNLGFSIQECATEESVCGCVEVLQELGTWCPE